MREFAGRTCVISGAGSGIGRALATALAQRGARLALSDIDGASAEDTARECAAIGADAEAHAVDVADGEAVRSHRDAVLDRFGAVHLVVNNAGVALHGDLLDTSLEDFEWIIGVNVWGVVHGSKAFLPDLIASGDGHLVNLSSIFGMVAMPGQSGYNASKFAVRGFTEALRQEMLMGGHPVGVTCVHPGGIRTSLIRSGRVAGTVDRNAMANTFDRIAVTSPERVARAIIRGVERNRARVIVGPDAHALDVMQRVLGSGYQGVMRRATAPISRGWRSRTAPESSG